MILVQCLVPLLIGGLYLLLTGVRPHGLFFSVTVPEGYADSDEARRILGRYRFAVCVHTVLAVGLVWAWSHGQLFPDDAVLVGLIWQIVWVMVGYAGARKAALPHSIDTWSVRQASLAPRAPEPGSSLWLQFIALVPLLASGLALALHWSSLPERFPAHWNIHGQADRWVAKSAGSVFSLLVVGLALCSVFAFLNWSIRNRTRRAVQGEGGAQMRQVLAMRSFVLRLLLATQCFIATLFSALALLPLLDRTTSVAVLHAILAGAGLYVVVLVIWSVAALTRRKEAAVPPGDLTPDQCWKAGIFYWNPNDPALFVEKRMGIGYTFNFARPSAWILILLIVILPLIIAGVGLHQK